MIGTFGNEEWNALNDDHPRTSKLKNILGTTALERRIFKRKLEKAEKEEKDDSFTIDLVMRKSGCSKSAAMTRLSRYRRGMITELKLFEKQRRW